MEDDDEFGDIYTDVLRPFSSSSAAASHSHELQATPPSLHRSFDLDIQSDDDKVLDGATNPNSTTSDRATGQTLITNSVEPATEPIITRIGDSDPQLIACAKSEEREAGKNEGLARDEKNLASDSLEASGSRVLESEDVKLRDGTLGDSDRGNKSGVGDIEAEGGPEDGNLLDRSVKFDVEEVQNSGEFNGEDVHESVRFDAEEVEDGTGDVGSEQIIPGLSSGSSLIHGVSGEVGNRESMDIPAKDNASGEGDDWDSDSEDDLQIVLNDNNHGPMAMDRGGADEDEDGLLIVADGDDQIHQVMEEQEWGEDAAQTGDGERKETGDAAKANGGTAVPPKVGYSNHGYHPFHSQFKYVRPGAAPMPGAATTGPGGVPGQVRPLVNTGIIAGRGRGDWRPVGMKNVPPMQKNFQPGFGVPPWSNNTAGRGFSGGQEFSLPSYKTIFDYDIDGFEEKPWKHPGVDISDYFNFSLNEESWKDYCKQLEQLRLEATMQSKIRVYESGRTEQEYDPDLPPELAAAAGFNDVLVENANLVRGDPGLGDLMKGSSRVRPPIPTGRAIQVEGGYGERLPSIDTRPPRIRDSDAIIEIVLQDAVDDDSSKGNGAQEQPDNELFREDLRADRLVEEDTVSVGTEFSDGFPRTYNGGKRDPVGRRAPSLNSARDNTLEGDGMSPFLPEAPVHHRAGSRSQTPVYSSRNSAHHDERRAQRRTRERSPHISPSESTRVNRFLDNPKEESVENMDGKDSPVVSSPASLRAAEESSLEQKDVVDNELVGGSPETERDGSLIASTSATVKDANSLQSVKKQKLSSRVEQPALQELDDGEDCKARSSENSKARSGSSKDYPKWRDGAEDEVIQDGRSARMGNIKRHLDEDEESYRRRDRDGRQEMERNRMVVKGREDSYPRKDWDSGSTHHLHMTTEFDRRKERENSDGAWQRRDADLHGRRIRTEETRKREYADEVGSRHWGKIRDIDKNDKDELGHSRKQLDNGSWRGHHDKDIESRHRERDDNTRNRYEIVDDLHNKRRKDEEHSRRDHVDKVEILHVQRESSSRRKRERDDGLDQRRRDDPPRIREQKDDGWLQRERVERQRERDERPRLKQSHEESLSKREREEVRAARSGRGAEDKTWVSHTKAKDEYKGSDKDYQMKDTGRHNELKRKDRLEDESVPHHRGRDDAYARGNQLNEDRRTRPDRSTSRNDRAVNASDNQRVHEKKHRDNTRKNKESEAVDHNTLGRSKRNQDDHLNAMVSLKGSYKQGNGQNDRQSSRKNKEDGSSDEEQQDSRKGRSKLERWTSHKDRDFTIKSSTSLKNKEVENISGGGSSLASKLSVPDDSAAWKFSSLYGEVSINPKTDKNPKAKTDKKPKNPKRDDNPKIDEFFHRYFSLICLICFLFVLLPYGFGSSGFFCSCFCLIHLAYEVNTSKRRSGHSISMGQQQSINEQQQQQQSRDDLVHELVCNGDVEAIKALCREGVSLECIDIKGKTPLIVASMHAGLYNVVKTLIELGANVNAYRPGRHGGTPLHHAAKRGLNETVKLLLSHGANAWARNDDCHTPLSVARTKGYTSVVRTIENHICYFSGWLREIYGPGFLGALAPQLLSRKIWVVVVPCGSSNPGKPLKFELVIYATSQDIQPRTVITLWNAQIEEPKFHKSDPALNIFDKSTKSRYKLASSDGGGQTQIQWLYNACRGIQGMSLPVVHDAATEIQSVEEAAEMAMAISASLQSAASEAHNTNGWGNSLDTTSQNGWGPAGGITGSEASTSGWINEPGNKQHGGWESGVTGIPDEPISASDPSAPPLPEEGLYEGPIHYPSIDTSPVDLSVPAEANEDGGGSTSSSCAICFEGRAEGACIPCGHMAGCVTCLNEIKSNKGACPVCRAKIDQVIRIYTV